MSSFTPKQHRALRRKLDRRHVQSREVDGRRLDYIEGWFAIAEANAIFGFGGWDREMTHFERLYERSRENQTSCGYLARVRIRVRAGEVTIVREGTGWGSASAQAPAEAHERALKAAETDATKRALATFGNRFGLGLYDKEQNGVTAKKSVSFTLLDPNGVVFAADLSAEAFCSGLRQMIEHASIEELHGLHTHNLSSINRLRRDAPKLKTVKNTHYSDILIQLIETKLRKLEGVTSFEHGMSSPHSTEKFSKIGPGVRVDKSILKIGTEKRLRDSAHLKFVASHACLICGRLPSQAHHVKFAQKPGLAIKVSDEFTVPLCTIHHDELHRHHIERDWWKSQAIDPMAIASELWLKSHQLGDAETTKSNSIAILHSSSAEGNMPVVGSKLQ